MTFDIVHVFRNISLASYEAMYYDETFNQEMMPVAGLKSRTMLERREENGVLHRKIRVVPLRDFPPPINKFVKEELSYIEHSSFDRASHRQLWRSEVNVLPGKLHLAGDLSFRAVDGGVERRVTGEMKVDVFGVGKIIEKMIIDDLKKTYDRVAAFSQRWIDEGKAPTS